MNRIIITFFFLIYVQSTFANSLIIPKVDIEYGAPFDYIVCPKIMGAFPITNQMRQELEDLHPAMTSTWNKSNNDFWKEIFNLLGKNYQDRSIKVTMSLCSKMPAGIVSPLMINVTYFIKSGFTGPPAPLQLLTNFIFHEMLHLFLNHHYPSTFSFTTPLLIKYRDEDIMVKMHLHLFSLQYAVYKSLDREKELLDFIKKTGTVTPHFVRAWNIIKSEGVSQFIDELQ